MNQDTLLKQTFDGQIILTVNFDFQFDTFPLIFNHLLLQ